MRDDSAALLAAFADQSAWCTRLGAPFTAALIDWLAAELVRGGPLRKLLPGWPGGNPRADLVPLRLVAGLHALVLSGRQPALATLYPPRSFDADALAPLLRRTFVDEAEHLRSFLASAPQTNETQRSAVLLAGYAQVAARTRLPLALREIGASAGLNLLWDRFGYRLGAQTWGDAASPVQLTCDWRGATPRLPASISVADRSGCDLAPVDTRDAGATLRLRAYVWPDQPERAARLAGALQLARETPPDVEACDAADWVDRTFAAPRAGVTTVLVHSVVWQYLPAATRARIEAALDACAAQASAEAPLAWLRLELSSPEGPAELRLTQWPEGAERLLARAHPHGAWAEWLAPASGG